MGGGKALEQLPGLRVKDTTIIYIYSNGGARRKSEIGKIGKKKKRLPISVRTIVTGLMKYGPRGSTGVAMLSVLRPLRLQQLLEVRRQRSQQKKQRLTVYNHSGVGKSN